MLGTLKSFASGLFKVEHKEFHRARISKERRTCASLGQDMYFEDVSLHICRELEDTTFGPNLNMCI